MNKEQAKRNKRLLNRLDKFLDEAELANSWVLKQFLKKENFDKTIRTIYTELVQDEVAICIDHLKVKGNGPEDIKELKARQRKGEKILEVIRPEQCILPSKNVKCGMQKKHERSMINTEGFNVKKSLR